MTVAAGCIRIEEICSAQLTESKFKASHRFVLGEGQRTAIVLDSLASQGYDVMKHHPCKVGLRAERWISNHIQVCEAGQAQCVANSSPAGALEVEQQFGAR